MTKHNTSVHKILCFLKYTGCEFLRTDETINNNCQKMKGSSMWKLTQVRDEVRSIEPI